MSRKHRLEELVATQFGGNQADLARAIGRSPSVVWQYLIGHRDMGEKFARHVESKLRLPSGWMDQNQINDQGAAYPMEPVDPQATLSPRQRALLGLFDALTEAQQEQVIRELEEKKCLNDELLEQLLARGKDRAAG